MATNLEEVSDEFVDYFNKFVKFVDNKSRSVSRRRINFTEDDLIDLQEYTAEIENKIKLVWSARESDSENKRHFI